MTEGLVGAQSQGLGTWFSVKKRERGEMYFQHSLQAAEIHSEICNAVMTLL